MEIRGWARTSLIDFPGEITTVFFTPGCNFRCPMCHNAALVLTPGGVPRVEEREIWDFLRKRAGLVTGVTLTGGEPTLHADLLPFLRRVRELGYATKMDTNGYLPERLASLLDEGVVDYVAMDVKAPPEKYAALSGVPEIDLTRIEESLALIRARAPAYEFRTTVVPQMLTEDDIAEIARWLEGSDRYVLQQYRGTHTLDPALAPRAPYPVPALKRMAERARRHITNVKLRGV